MIERACNIKSWGGTCRWVLALSSAWLLQPYTERQQWRVPATNKGPIKDPELASLFLVLANPQKGHKTVVVDVVNNIIHWADMYH